MNGLERMRAVFSGVLPDRVPFLPTIYTDYACQACGHDFADALADPRLGNRLMLEAALTCGADAVRLRAIPGHDWFKTKRVLWSDDAGGRGSPVPGVPPLHAAPRCGQLLQVDKSTGAREGIFDLEGGGAFIPDTRPAPVGSLADVAAIPVPSRDELLATGQFEGVAELVAEAHAAGLFTVGMAGGQTLNFMAHQLHSASAALLCLVDEPERARALIEKGVATSLEVARAFIACGVDCLYIGDSFASASVISPEAYHSFCTPAYRAAADAIRAEGVFCYKHCCGNYDPLLQYVLESGVDGMDGLDPTSGMSVARTKAAIGAHITLMGGISCMTLLQGSDDDVYEEARRCVVAGKPGGRYVLGSACAVPRATPQQNLQAAQRAAVDSGGYATAGGGYPWVGA